MTHVTTIRNAMRLIAASSAVLLATSAGSAFAHSSTFDGANETTGAYSSNSNKFDVEHDSKLDVKNKSDIDNKIKGDLNTGYNDLEYNTTASDGIGTGVIDANVVVSNDTSGSGSVWGGLGTLDLGGGSGTGMVDASFENGTTGYSSENTNKLKVDNKKSVTVKNDAYIDNKVDIKANTGDNKTIGNTTVDGSTTTGDIVANVDISNKTAGTPDLSSLGLGGTDVTASAENGVTGAFSNNVNDVKVTQTDTVKIDNKADINNDVKLKANTGGNANNYNTTTGGTNTGSIGFGVNVSNTTN